MNRYLSAEPTTDAQLFDVMHGLFGIGDYADCDDRPYYRFRGIEISKVKSLRKKRGITIDQLALAARYCYRRRLPITTPFDLVEHIGAALRERALARREVQGQRMSQAADLARASGEPDWADRLLLAQGAHRQGVLDEWAAWQHTSEPPIRQPEGASP